MLQAGIVQKLNLNTASVQITRSSSCGENCASCGLCPGQTAVVEAANNINASVGDNVVIDMADKKVLGAAFLVYIVPIIMLVVGYFLGDILFKNESVSILTAFLLMVVTFIAIIFIDKRIKRHYTPQIVRILPSDE